MVLAARGAREPLGVVRRLFFPRQLIEGRLVAPFPIAIFRQVEFLMLVIFDAGAVLIAPSVPFSINATRFIGAIIQLGDQSATTPTARPPMVASGAQRTWTDPRLWPAESRLTHYDIGQIGLL